MKSYYTVNKLPAGFRHYNIGAKPIPSAFSGGPKRFMLADEDAWALFSKDLSEEE